MLRDRRGGLFIDQRILEESPELFALVFYSLRFVPVNIDAFHQGAYGSAYYGYSPFFASVGEGEYAPIYEIEITRNVCDEGLVKGYDIVLRNHFFTSNPKNSVEPVAKTSFWLPYAGDALETQTLPNCPGYYVLLICYDAQECGFLEVHNLDHGVTDTKELPYGYAGYCGPFYSELSAQEWVEKNRERLEF